MSKVTFHQDPVVHSPKDNSPSDNASVVTNTCRCGTWDLSWTWHMTHTFVAKLILEVFGGAGAIWGFSEAVGLRTVETIWFWRPAALSVGFCFFLRWLLQIRHEVALWHFRTKSERHLRLSLNSPTFCCDNNLNSPTLTGILSKDSEDEEMQMSRSSNGNLEMPHDLVLHESEATALNTHPHTIPARGSHRRSTTH